MPALTGGVWKIWGDHEKYAVDSEAVTSHRHLADCAHVLARAGWAASDATTHPAKAAPKPTWHALSLKNQWKSAAKGYNAARPQYTIVNDVVFLDGAASRANQTLPLTQVIGYLPKGARPSHVLSFAAANYAANGESSIYVFPNGAIEVGGNGGDENYFTSLNGIEFPLGS